MDVRLGVISMRLRTQVLRRNLMRSTGSRALMGLSMLPKGGKFWSSREAKKRCQKQMPRKRLMKKTD